MPDKPNLSVKTGDWATLAPHALPVRLRVFVQEQLVPIEMEVDQWDPMALHAVVFDEDGAALATGRLVSENPDGGSESTLSASANAVGRIGRVAVIAACRGQGIGKIVMAALIQAANEQGIKRLTLHAQSTASGFYEQLGFSPIGKIFEEAGIAHVEMWRYWITDETPEGIP